MTGSEPTERSTAIADSWTCARCTMTVSFAADAEQPGMPPSWTQQDGELYCLSCRREMAGEEGLEGIDDETSNEQRIKLRTNARVEFEIGRDPERPDNQIAKACHTSAVSVRKARERMGIATPPRT
jgi:hypothetical protein